jgi:AAA15 family ATPase/GTPase
VQFISTTHDSSLMDLLKPHQVYFVEKGNVGESEIFKLSDFETRNDTKYSPKYEEGEFGANQIINEVGLMSLLGGADE